MWPFPRACAITSSLHACTSAHPSSHTCSPCILHPAQRICGLLSPLQHSPSPHLPGYQSKATLARSSTRVSNNSPQETTHPTSVVPRVSSPMGNWAIPPRGQLMCWQTRPSLSCHSLVPLTLGVHLSSALPGEGEKEIHWWMLGGISSQITGDTLHKQNALGCILFPAWSAVL